MRWKWLVLAAALLALSAWLMSRGDPSRPFRRRAESKFRRQTNDQEVERAARRRTHVPELPSPGQPPQPAVDPVMVALPHEPGTSTVVFEAASIRDTPVGRHLIDCVLMRGGRAGRRGESLQKTLGFDPFERTDRVAISGDVVVFEGDFTGARWADVCAERGTRRPYGAKTDMFCSFEDGRALAVREGMVLMGDADADVQNALDRLDGTAPPAPPAFPEWAAYGEVYGVFAVETLASMLGREDPALAERFRAAAERVEIHVGLTDEVYVVADVVGADPAQTSELAKSLGAGLAVARMKARAEEDDRLAVLLDLARVDPHEGRFAVDVAVPLEVLVEKLAPCRDPEADGGR